MNVNIHQAKYGFKNQVGHALLSSNLDKREVLDALRNATDLPSNPPYGVRWNTHFSICKIEDYFILNKTFPDNSFDRGDTVFTHSLIIAVDQLQNIDSLARIFDLFPHDIDKTSLDNAELITYEPTGSGPVNIPVQACIAHQLAQNGLAICSGNSEEYLTAICSIWGSLPRPFKAALRLRIGFDPENIKSDDNIIMIPPALEQKWSEHDIIKPDSNCIAKSEFEKVLAGIAPLSKDLQSFFDLLENIPLQFSQLNTIEESAKLTQKIDLDNTRRLCMNVGFLSPNQDNSTKIKEQLLTRLSDLLPAGSPKEILRLRNFPVSAFINGRKKLSTVIANIIRSQIEHPDFDATIISKIAEVRNDPDDWWSTSTNNAISKQLSIISAKKAGKVWGWLNEDESLIEPLFKDIGLSSENESHLLEKAPSTMPETTGSQLMSILANYDWFKLHGEIASKTYGYNAAIAKHLSVDSDVDRTEGVEALCANVNNENLLRYVLTNPEPRLIKILGRKISKQKKHFKKLDPAKAVWRSIWKESYQHNNNIWFGIGNPTRFTEKLLDQLIAGENIDQELLDAISISHTADISNIKQRQKVWAHLPSSSIDGFITNTLNGLLLSSGTNFEIIANLEPELESVLISQLTSGKNNILASRKIMVELKINLIRKYKLSEVTFLFFLENDTSNLSKDEAELIGKTIIDLHWTHAAKTVKNVKWKRSDLLPAWALCKHLAPDSFFGDFNLFGKSDKKQWQAHQPSTTMKHKILFMASSPEDLDSLNLMKEVATVEEKIQSGKYRDALEIKPKVAVKFDVFTRCILEEEPDIIHFSGHGNVDGIAMEYDNGTTHFINRTAIEQIFGLQQGSVKCVVLNACYSEKQARAISKYGIYVVGMINSIADDAAIAFSAGFYQSIGAGKDFETSFKWGLTHVTALASDINQQHVPKLWKDGVIVA